MKEERRDSRDHSHEAWEPEWIQYVYSCLLVCSNDQCKEVVASSGSTDCFGGKYAFEVEERMAAAAANQSLVSAATLVPRTGGKHITTSAQLCLRAPMVHRTTPVHPRTHRFKPNQPPAP